MKDLDFDEIDRAVNSVISNSSGDNSAKDMPAPEPEPVESAPEPQTEPESTPTPPLAARRSSGQFMDVVHPSSDMRRAAVDVPERPNITPVTPQPVEQPTTLPVPEPSDAENVATKAEETTGDSYNDADIDKISDDISKALGNSTETSLESPFISGTKVEKRPLGAFSTESTTEGGNQDEPANKTEFAPNPITEAPFSPDDTPLPAELQDDLLKIEADVSTDSEMPTPSEDQPAPENTNPIIPESEASAAVEPETAASEVSPVESTELTMPASITQQYKEQPSTGDQSTGAIYDTSTYHKSLTSPVKKKPAWKWAMYIAILLAVGGAVGAAVFYFVIPLL